MSNYVLVNALNAKKNKHQQIKTTAPNMLG